ncbi:hypothetical protein JCM10908_005039 [Rhodotorula pacifica]|uniref:uncharacterized protein n=1 Tax=Rhodotorula pacifica TaxID=1495444 RepID=UPI00316C99E3
MAHALLLSPATRFDSPDSSPGNASSSLSPATPPPPSLDFLEDLAGLGELDTPSRGGPIHSTVKEGAGGLPSNPLPEWLTDELDEEWLNNPNPAASASGTQGEGHLLSFLQDDIEDTGSEAGYMTASTGEGSTTFLAQPHPHPHPLPYGHAADSPSSSSSAASTVTPATPPPPAVSNRFPWQSQPRVPSSLRHGFTAASSPSGSVVSATTTAHHDMEHTRDMSIASSFAPLASEGEASFVDELDNPERDASLPYEHQQEPSTQSNGSDNSIIFNSVVDRGAAAANGGEKNQLQAAVRALRGPNAGLFAGSADEQADEGALPEESLPKGLLGLFQPPTPPNQNATPLPKSTRPAPTLESFAFSPPDPIPHTSWKDLEHFSPPREEAAEAGDDEVTPVPRRNVPLGLATPRQGPQATPAAGGNVLSPTGAAGPAAVGKRERFLKRSVPPSSTTVAQPLASSPPPPPAAAIVQPVSDSRTRDAHPSETDSSSDDDDEGQQRFVAAGAGVPVDYTGATATTDEDDSTATSTDEEDEEEAEAIRVGGGAVDEGLLLGESKPGLGWSSDEDEHDQDGDDADHDEPSDSYHPRARGEVAPFPPPRHPFSLTALRHQHDEITAQSATVPPHSPAQIPLPSTASLAAPTPTAVRSSSSASSSSENVLPPPSPLKLFQPIYDTLTRSHLAALVDEIDTLGQNRDEYFREGAPAPSHLPMHAEERHLQPQLNDGDGQHAETSDEGFLGEEGEKRSSKRIRLSPSQQRGMLDRIEENASEQEEENRSIDVSAVSTSSRRTSRSRNRRSPASAASTARRPPLSRRRRDTYIETERIMDRLRRKENEADAHRSASSRSSLRISGPQAPLRTSTSQETSVSPPTLPKLAAAATASIRSALSSSAPPSPSLSHGLPSSLDEQRKGSFGRRQFARTPVSQARKPRRTEVHEQASATPTQSTQPDRTKTGTTLTHLHPQSSTTQRMLASAGSSARDKGLAFDAQQGRWIRTRRSHALHGDLVEAGHESKLEAVGVEEEEDPFRDFSQIRSGDRSVAALSASAAPKQARLPAKGADSLALSGLGISEGTPPLPARNASATMAPIDKPDQPSPEGGFEPPPVDARPADEDPEGPVLQLESEDSATWGRNDAERKQQAAGHDGQGPAESSPRAGTAGGVEDSVIVESSMLKLYQRAHAHQDDTDTGSTSISQPPAPSSVLRRLSDTDAGFSSSHAKPPLQPPRSALKAPRSQSEPIGGVATPIASRVLAAAAPPRSVSFSDGKTSGKIEGLDNVRATSASRATTQPAFLIGTKGGPGSLQFDGFETQSESEAGGESEADRTITQADATEKMAKRAATSRSARRSDLSASINSSTTSSPALSLTGSRNGSRTFVRTRSQNGNATFLTECSFGVSHDRLLQYITDVEPFEPDWEGLRSIDLSGKKAEGVIRLKEFLPNLDEVNLNNNAIAYLTGIPPSLRTLLAASNRLTDLTSFQHLSNLERLDISNNQLESVRHLACLRHLRELKADGNRISCLDGLADLDSLVRVSLKNNHLSELDFSRTNWTRLETLHLARNQISRIRGLERLQSLTTLNLDHNRVSALSAESPMPRLRVLRICQNPLPQLDISFAPRLRTLFADSAQLGAVQGTDQLGKLENLSVRDQSGGALTLTMPHLRDVKRLYLSGNPLPRSFPSEKFFNLVYLELAMCQLSTLPDNLAAVIPNVRVLNLNHNFLSDLSPLSGLTRCTRLSIVGARISKARHLATVLAGLPELEVVDLRMNPLTLAFYPPLVPSGESMLPAHAEHRILHPDSLPSSIPSSALDDPVNNSSAWLKLDTKFRRSLPDEWYHRRAAYRAVVLQSVPALTRLDGIDVAKERGRLTHKLEKLAGQAA